MAKKIITLILILVASIAVGQISVSNTSFTINHGDLVFYLDKDTASYISVQHIRYSSILGLTGERSDKWHKEPPRGPYTKEAYLHTGYDLGHLTPSNITSYNDTLNYISFSFFNQAPQLAGFNRGKWAQLEGKIENIIRNQKTDATILTGVLYNNKFKDFLGASRIKIPIIYYKILLLNNKQVYSWVGSNINGLITETSVEAILDLAKANGNALDIQVTK